VGQNPPLCLVPADRRYVVGSRGVAVHGSRIDCMPLSLPSTDGPIRAEPQPRDTLTSESVPAWCVPYYFSWPSLIHLTTPTTMAFVEELPVRLAHRVKELDELPHNLNAMPSINKVKDWYAQSFEVLSVLSILCMTSLTIQFRFAQELISFPPVETSKDIQTALKLTSSSSRYLPESVPNPSFNGGLGNPVSGKMRIPMEKR
jgi:hypothetical protein